MESFLIYDTQDYEIADPVIKVKIDFCDKTFERVIIPDRVLIWMVTKYNATIDIYSYSQTLINDMQVINDIIDKNTDIKNIDIKFYPSREQEEIYIRVYNKSIPIMTQRSRSIPSSHAYMAQIDIKTKIDINYLDKYFENINQPFEIVTRTESEMTKEEIDFINKTMLLQNDNDWFQDNKKKKSNIDLSFLKPSNLIKASKPQNKDISTPKTDDKIFDAKSLKIEPGSLDPMGDLENIIGLGNVKREIEKLESTLEYKKERSQRGIEDNTYNSLHMCFYGAPGTGKTTIARIMTGLLYKMGYIKENKCVEINGLEFKGGYVGQTEIITKSILDASIGGVLFVDEAYALCNGNDDAYGREAVNTFIKEMEDNRDKLIVIFAGYEKDMEEFLDVNSGFRSRINRYFKFENYTSTELAEILINKLRKKHLKITPECLNKCIIAFKKAKKYHKFGNGRFVGNLLEKIEEQHMINVMNEIKFDPKAKKNKMNEYDEFQDTITINDFPDEIIDTILLSLKG